MNPRYETLPRDNSRYFQTIFRLNKKTVAIERQKYFAGVLPNHLKKDGWQEEVKKGKRIYKTN